MALTKREIDQAQFDPKGGAWQVLMDDEVMGFGVRLLSSGKKSFIVRYRNPKGQTRMLTLGRHGVLSVKQARDLAIIELAKVAKNQDPQDERKQARGPGLKVSEFWERYLEAYAKRHRRSWRNDERRYLKNILPAIGDRVIWEVTPKDVRKIHQEIGNRAPVEANRVVELLRLIFNLAMDWEKPPRGFENPARLVGNRKGAGNGHVKRYREESRTKWLNREEISYLLEALAEETDIYAASAIRLLLYTGLRKSELLAAKWDHLDLERGELFVPERRADEDFTLPLNALALKELSSLPRQHGSPWIFPSDRNPEEHRRDVKRQWDRVREKTGLEDIRMQDLRRTAGSWMAQAGVPLAWIQEVLGQQSPEVVKVYARLAEESAQTAVDRYASALDLALKGWSHEGRGRPLRDRKTADQGIEFPGGRLYPIDLWLPRHR